jgi:hypothetical protein
VRVIPRCNLRCLLQRPVMRSKAGMAKQSRRRHLALRALGLCKKKYSLHKKTLPRGLIHFHYSALAPTSVHRTVQFRCSALAPTSVHRTVQFSHHAELSRSSGLCIFQAGKRRELCTGLVALPPPTYLLLCSNIVGKLAVSCCEGNCC